MMTFTQGKDQDLPQLLQLYRAATKAMQADGLQQWDDIYPSTDILKADIARGQLQFLSKDADIVAAFVLNRVYDAGYWVGHWSTPKDACVVLHRLCVNPAFQHQGIARAIMNHLEQSCRATDIQAIRLDVFCKNLQAYGLYRSLNYKTVGSVKFRKGLFYLMEKRL